MSCTSHSCSKYLSSAGSEDRPDEEAPLTLRQQLFLFAQLASSSFQDEFLQPVFTSNRVIKV